MSDSDNVTKDEIAPEDEECQDCNNEDQNQDAHKVFMNDPMELSFIAPLPHDISLKMVPNL